MKNFAMVQEHFRKLRCTHCQAAFTPEGIKLLREEPDYWMVRVHCTACQQPSGVAIIGMDYGTAAAPAGEAPTRRREEPSPRRVTFASKKEEERFAALPAIGHDEVLDAHRFFDGLGDDWMRELKRARGL